MIFMRFGGPGWRQDSAKTRPRWLQDAASNLALFQEASKTPPDFDFHGFGTLPGSIFDTILMIFRASSFHKTIQRINKSRELEELKEARKEETKRTNKKLQALENFEKYGN